VELRVVAGRSRMQAGLPHAVSGRPMLVHTCHAVPMPRCAVALINCFQKGIVVAWHGTARARLRRVMTCVNQTRPIGRIQSKPLAICYGRGTAWERNGMYELAFKVLNSVRLLIETIFFFPVAVCGST
jgi:hypothetical protein